MCKHFMPVISGGEPYVGISLAVLARLAAVAEAARQIDTRALHCNDPPRGWYSVAPSEMCDLHNALDAPEIVRMWEEAKED